MAKLGASSSLTKSSVWVTLPLNLRHLKMQVLINCFTIFFPQYDQSSYSPSPFSPRHSLPPFSLACCMSHCSLFVAIFRLWCADWASREPQDVGAVRVSEEGGSRGQPQPRQWEDALPWLTVHPLHRAPWLRRETRLHRGDVWGGYVTRLCFFWGDVHSCPWQNSDTQWSFKNVKSLLFPHQPCMKNEGEKIKIDFSPILSPWLISEVERLELHNPLSLI